MIGNCVADRGRQTDSQTCPMSLPDVVLPFLVSPGDGSNTGREQAEIGNKHFLEETKIMLISSACTRGLITEVHSHGGRCSGRNSRQFWMKGLWETVQELSMYGVPVLAVPVVRSYLHTHKHTLAPEILYC